MAKKRTGPTLTGRINVLRTDLNKVVERVDSHGSRFDRVDALRHELLLRIEQLEGPPTESDDGEPSP